MSSLYVGKARKGKWRVMERVFVNGESNDQTVPVDSYLALGINPSWTIEEARLRVSEINELKSVDKRKALTAARRSIEISVVESLLVPEDLCSEFYKDLCARSFGTDSYNKKMLSHWQYVQRMIAAIGVDASEYYENAALFYRYFADKKSSLNYVHKLISILNAYGKFVCRKRKQPYEPVPVPKMLAKQSINRAYQKSENYQGPSDPLTPQMLEQHKHKLTVPGNYEFLYLSVWFGLRPWEIDCLKNPHLYKIHEQDGVKILSVFQTKLNNLPDDQRWKFIPAVTPEQLNGLALIKGTIKRPLVKTVKKIFGEKVKLYGGRKNFEDMFFDLGYSIEDISSWLGHQDISISWRRYRNRKRIGGKKAG